MKKSILVLLMLLVATQAYGGAVYFSNGCVDVVSIKETANGVFYTTADGNSWITASRIVHYSSTGNCAVPPTKEPCPECGMLTLRGALCNKCMDKEI